MRSGSAIVIHDDEEEEVEEEEEQHGLLKPGSSSSSQEVGRRCGVRGWRQRLAILGSTAVAFVAGYIVHAATAAAGSSFFLSLRHPIVKSSNNAIIATKNDNDEPLFNATFTTYLLTGMSIVLAKQQNRHTTIPPYKRTYYVYDSLTLYVAMAMYD